MRAAALRLPGALALALAWGSAALAHGLTERQLAVEMHGAQAAVVFTPTAKAFPEVDTNHDGAVDLDEVRAHRDAILAKADAGLTLTDQDGHRGERIFSDVLVGKDHHSGAEGAFLKFILRYRWEAVPTSLTLRCDLFEEADPGVTALVAVGSAVAGGPSTLAQALRGQGTLDPAHPALRFDLAAAAGAQAAP